MKGKTGHPLKKRVLIEFVFKNCKSLYLLEANEALMLQRPLCLSYRMSLSGRRRGSLPQGHFAS